MSSRSGGVSSKAQWIADYHQFSKKGNVLEKEVHGKLFGKKTDLPPYAASLLSYQNDLDKSRITEEKALHVHLEKIKVSVGRLKNQVQNAKLRDDTYVTTLENLMNYIERELVSVKSAIRTSREELSVEELTMEREMGMLEKKLESLEEDAIRQAEPSGPSPSAPSSKPTKPSVERMKVGDAVPPEVDALQAFIAETGVNGGWLDKDHKQFIHIRAQCKGNLRQLIERCIFEIPEKDYAIVEDHEQWYNTYTSLFQAQKAAIQRWKANKEAIRAADIKEDEEKQAREIQKRQIAEREARRREKEDRELQILEWKEEQRKRNEEEKEKAIRDEERKAQEVKDREMRRRAIVKEKLQEYMQKEEDERQRRMEESSQKITSVHKVTSKDLEKFQERDRMKEIDKQQKAMISDLQKAEKEARLEKLRQQVHVSAPRDPSRLTKPTAAFEVRVNEVEQKALYPNMDFTGPFATRKAIPAWRQGL